MQSTEKLKLHEKLAAVKCSTDAATDEIAGVVAIIPAGEVIHIDLTAPLVGRIRQVEWKGNGTAYLTKICKNGQKLPIDLMDRASLVQTALRHTPELNHSSASEIR